MFDTSVFGATSPVSGQRYRFEVAPTLGTLQFTGLLADYRRYLMVAPFYTVAVRGIHYGRYGSGAMDDNYGFWWCHPGLSRGETHPYCSLYHSGRGPDPAGELAGRSSAASRV